MSCFEGRLEELKNVSIDCFECKNLFSTAYFLSHCHTDHMVGLRSQTFLKRLMSETGIYLYCSEITSHILTSEYTFAGVVHKIKALPLGVASIILIPVDDGSIEVTVSLIPTGHCPGAVMFLFEGEMGHILYTGDFRICEGDASRFRQLHYLDGTVKPIDKLYLDTTFLSRQYECFPSRSDSITILCDLIISWLQESSDNDVYIKTSANYGSEALFIAVAKRLGKKIHVREKAYNIYKNVAEIRDAVTNSPCSTRIHACEPCNKNLQTAGGKTLLPCQNKWSSLRIIKPCALTFTSKVYNGSLTSAVLRSEDQEFIRICYSCHCSYRELEHFIKYLKPKQIEACVVPLRMGVAGTLHLLKEISFPEMPMLSVSSREIPKIVAFPGTEKFCNAGCSGEQIVMTNANISYNKTVIEEEGMQTDLTEESCANAEIYRSIAEDLRPNAGDPDTDIRQSISLTFLERASVEKKGVFS